MGGKANISANISSTVAPQRLLVHMSVTPPVGGNQANKKTKHESNVAQ